MGRSITHLLARLLAAVVLGAVIVGPLRDAAVAADQTTQATPAAPAQTVQSDPLVAGPVAAPAPGFTDDATRVSFDPPFGWVREPSSALNPQSDPPDPAQEVVRFQPRLSDASLYAQPIPITSALIRDAGAIITVGVARAGGDLIDLDVDPRVDKSEVTLVAGFYQLDDERTYEGLHILTRSFVARASDRRLVMRAVTAEEDWAALAPLIRASMATFRADPAGPNAPAAPPPPAIVVAEPVALQPALDSSPAIRQSILDRAAAMLSTPYVWGGNTPNRAMDCSAYVSAVWGVARYTTESIGWVSAPIAKGDLRSGDAMNLTIGRDPQGYGHIRLFEAWANEAHTLVWVFEETPPRAVHRVVVYDDRYQPIRLAGLSNAGAAPLVPAPAPAPEPAFVPSESRSGGGGNQTPRPRATPRPVTPRPAPTVRPTIPSNIPQLYAPGTRPVLTATPKPTITVRPTPRPTQTPTPTASIRR